MPRVRRRRPTERSIPAHPSLIETELRAWAGTPIADGGRRDALLGRVEVLSLSLDGERLEARVRGQGRHAHRPRVWVQSGGGLTASCSCTGDDAPPCRHAVAALEALRFPPPEDVQSGLAQPSRQRRRGRWPGGQGRVIQPAHVAPGFVLVGGLQRLLTRDERIRAALAEEVDLRRLIARRSRRAVHLLDDLGGALQYEVDLGRHGGRHVVSRRRACVDGFACSCPDFAANELGTCAHIERVRAARGRRGDPPREPSAEHLMIWWRSRPWIDEVPDLLREIRMDGGDPAQQPLTQWFAADGWLRPPEAGAPPADWIDAALRAASEEAARQQRPFDVDPAVLGLSRRLVSGQSETQQRAVEATTPAWRRVVSGLRLVLHPYQERGALFLAARGRAFLADDMGLGKTLQAIAAALLLRETVGALRALVVCPASLKHQWSREIVKACGEAATVVEGPRAVRHAAYAAWQKGFLIINYELLLRDMEAIRSTQPPLIVLDEAQRIKNWHTKTAQAVKALESPLAFVLTGTPLENRLIELHSLMEYLHPRLLGPRWRLLPFHAVSERDGRVVAYEGLDVLRARLRANFLRRERAAVLDQLPERTDITFWTALGPVQRGAYRRHAAAVATLTARRTALRAEELRALLQGLTAMRILCNAHAQQAWSRWERRLGRPEPPTRQELRALHAPKLEEFARVLDDLLDESTERIVVFSQWERMLRLAEFVARQALASRELHGGVFHGGLTSRQREAMIAAFREDPSFRVLFSTDAGGLGLNLQEAASIVVNLEVPWNPAILEQRIARVHRFGQVRGVRVLHFVTRDAIEERVRGVIEAKRSLFDGLLVDEVDRVVLDSASSASLVERVRTLTMDEARGERGQ